MRLLPRVEWQRLLATLVFFVSALGVAVAAFLGSTPNDFLQPGTQPLGLTDDVVTAANCFFCHGAYDPDVEPFDHWSAGMMANAMRDPVFHAALAIAEQDADYVGEMCIRCHSPGGWLGGRSQPTDGSALFGKDYEGVTCNFCHRMVDPIAAPENPAADTAILSGLAFPPAEAHGGQYVVDPLDNRRGPFVMPLSFGYHYWLLSPFHQESLLCATCHEVSNPAFTRAGGATPAATDTYPPNTLDAPHPTQSRFDEFPLERTYSEWLMSDFAVAPIDMGGLFGGNKTAVSSCQDCHMPDTSGEACAPGFGGEYRDDLPRHDFNGANSWVPLSIHSLDQSLLLYGPSEASYVPLASFQAAVDRNVSMLQRASDLELEQVGGRVRARVTNQTGHKLPTGYPEGRRMWLNVRFFDAQGVLIGEHGAYDAGTATLTTGDTKVYRMEIGLDADMAAMTGLPEGPSLHFALNNEVYEDNRIPPRGYTFAKFESVQAQPVGYSYADGQYWDDTLYDVPCGAATVEVRVYHQTTTKEYIEFLRDENVTNNAGQIAYDEWVTHGKSAPVEMDLATLQLAPVLSADVDSISVSTGGQQTLCVDAGPAWAGQLYWVVGSTSGTVPGTPVGGLVVPLNYDSWFQYTVANPNGAILVNTMGTLDADGRATAAISIPPGVAPTLHVDHAFGVIQPPLTGLAVSNPLGLDLVP